MYVIRGGISSLLHGFSHIYGYTLKLLCVHMYTVLTTGIASVNILGMDSPISLVLRSQRAPSMNKPLTYTPVS